MCIRPSLACSSSSTRIRCPTVLPPPPPSFTRHLTVLYTCVHIPYEHIALTHARTPSFLPSFLVLDLPVCFPTGAHRPLRAVYSCFCFALTSSRLPDTLRCWPLPPCPCSCACLASSCLVRSCPVLSGLVLSPVLSCVMSYRVVSCRVVSCRICRVALPPPLATPLSLISFSFAYPYPLPPFHFSFQFTCSALLCACVSLLPRFLSFPFLSIPVSFRSLPFCSVPFRSVPFHSIAINFLSSSPLFSCRSPLPYP